MLGRGNNNFRSCRFAHLANLRAAKEATNTDEIVNICCAPVFKSELLAEESLKLVSELKRPAKHKRVCLLPPSKYPKVLH